MGDKAYDPGIPAASRHGPEHALERLIFFSDAVFAIAITLLVIELKVPHIERGSDDQAFVIGLLRMIPNFIGFIISFFVIGAFWGGHHRAFGCAAHWDERLRFPNIMMLFTIAAMPFFTAFVSEYNNARVPVVAYCMWLLFTSLINVWLVKLATSPPVIDATVPANTIRSTRQRGVATALGAATAVIVAIFSPIPILAQVSLMAIPLWRVVLGWGAKRPAAV